MVDAASAGGSREQTLLEAAKAMSCQCTGHPSQAQWEVAVANLRAAIAREEERPPATTDGERRCWEGLVDSWRKGHDEQAARAKQAEAERDLAKSQLALSLSRLERQSVLILSATQASGCRIPEDVSDSIRRLRARAEKAEAECREQRARAESGEDRNRDLCEKLIAAHGKTHAESERAKKAEAEATSERKKFADYASKVMDQDLKAAMGGKPMVATFNGTCSFKFAEPKDAPVEPRDPLTGWTFATYRRLLQAAFPGKEGA